MKSIVHTIVNDLKAKLLVYYEQRIPIKTMKAHTRPSGRGKQNWPRKSWRKRIHGEIEVAYIPWGLYESTESNGIELFETNLSIDKMFPSWKLKMTV